MGQKERLSEVEKGKILAFKETGLTNHAIAKKIDRSSSVVDNFLKKNDKYVLYKGSGTVSKLTARSRWKICRLTIGSSDDGG